MQISYNFLKSRSSIVEVADVTTNPEGTPNGAQGGETQNCTGGWWETGRNGGGVGKRLF